MSDGHITEDLLRAHQFKWSQMDRQPSKHWSLMIGRCLQVSRMHGLSSPDDLMIEVAQVGPHDPDAWMCWLRSDVAGLYTRFIYVGTLTTWAQVCAMVLGLTQVELCERNCLWGQLWRPEDADRLRAEAEALEQRLDVQLARYSNDREADAAGKRRPINE